jgi:hypothetical protein
MKIRLVLAMCLLCVGASGALAIQSVFAADKEKALLQVDRAAFGTGPASIAKNYKLLDPNFTWTDSSGKTRNKSEILQEITSGKKLPTEAGGRSGDGKIIISSISARTFGQIGLVQTNNGKLYALRIWVKRGDGWHLLIYQAVSIGAPPSAEAGGGYCENPCKFVPFQPQSEDEREVVTAYQAVERAVAAHNSAAWAAHIADEFFAVTSNSDRPLDKAARMKGLDAQKVGGIAPFPLVSARMFNFGSAMVMTSLQQPEHGLPIHVTRVWFKRNGVWLEAYSYQTTIQGTNSARSSPS